MALPKELANALRFLSIDAIQKANSGHPGMPMGMADIATVLWREFLKHNPANPKWSNRDRFVISNGHGSMLLYSLLHLSGYELSLEDIKQFRQLNSKTPGHPENTHTVGVETTTGPLGQGFANAVGMALAEKVLAAQFNRPGATIVDHYTYMFCGDGCLMEGVSHEAASLAGHHKLGKLIAFWDDNNISIDGDVSGWFTDNTAARFESYGWHVITGVDGHDPEAVRKAILEARFVNDRPSLICCRTVIGFGAPHLANSCKSHGSPLGEAEVAATRKQLQWHYDPFEIPDAIRAAWNAVPKGKELEQHWQQLFASYKEQYPELAAEFERRIAGQLPADLPEKAKSYLAALQTQQESLATRKASQNCLDFYGPMLPELLGGSADLTGSNLTNWQQSQDITPDDSSGNYIHYGVREFGMAAIMNGIALHGGFIPYGGTFLVFSDYARNAIRLSAMMQQRVIYVLTHDSIGLGEDGPTHQPIEHLTMLRATPGLMVWRPCDTVETAVAWQMALENSAAPACLVLTRQKVAAETRDTAALANISRGAYVLFDAGSKVDGIIIATGSEVAVAMEAAKALVADGHGIRVVSMPSMELFEQQDKAYQEQVLPAAVSVRIAVEAGSSCCWYKYVGLSGAVVGIDSFGKSAPAEELFADYKITAQNVASLMLALFKNNKI